MGVTIAYHGWRMDGTTVPVRVRASECAWLSCLQVGHATYRSAAGLSGCSARVSSDLSCVRWEEQGCPPEANRSLASIDRLHPNCAAPRFGSRVTPTARGRVRCLACRRLVLRWLAAALIEATHGC